MPYRADSQDSGEAEEEQADADSGTSRSGRRPRSSASRSLPRLQRPRHPDVVRYRADPADARVHRRLKLGMYSFQARDAAALAEFWGQLLEIPVDQGASNVSDEHAVGPPRTPGASPLAFTYADSPGLLIYTGHQRRGAHIPVCACDACDETLKTCLDQLPELLEPVVAGTFGESVVIEDGRWYHQVWRTWSAGRGSGAGPVDDEEADALLKLMPEGEATWQPWILRSPAPGPVPARGLHAAARRARAARSLLG